MNITKDIITLLAEIKHKCIHENVVKTMYDCYEFWDFAVPNHLESEIEVYSIVHDLEKNTWQIRIDNGWNWESLSFDDDYYKELLELNMLLNKEEAKKLDSCYLLCIYCQPNP